MQGTEGERRGAFNLDTGANGNLVFHAKAVDDLGLLEGRTVNAAVSGGVGGTVPVSTGRLAWFELAGQRFEDIQVTFALGEIGTYAAAGLLGSIGGGLLRSFTLVFDYPHSRMAFSSR